MRTELPRRATTCFRRTATALLVVVVTYGVEVARGSEPGGATTAGNEAGLAGAYVCMSPGACPCQADRLALSEDGRWRLGEHAGTFSLAAGQVTFDGGEGPPAWGRARVGNRALPFDGATPTVVCGRPGSEDPARAP